MLWTSKQETTRANQNPEIRNKLFIRKLHLITGAINKSCYRIELVGNILQDFK